ncbi:MAG: hypothetical protein U9O94_03960 [Nanoarchaeota archaeon]|nr:hypothetical protein [Nanoarchaeota archaeon]
MVLLNDGFGDSKSDEKGVVLPKNIDTILAGLGKGNSPADNLLLLDDMMTNPPKYGSKKIGQLTREINNFIDDLGGMITRKSTTFIESQGNFDFQYGVWASHSAYNPKMIIGSGIRLDKILLKGDILLNRKTIEELFSNDLIDKELFDLQLFDLQFIAPVSTTVTVDSRITGDYGIRFGLTNDISNETRDVVGLDHYHGGVMMVIGDMMGHSPVTSLKEGRIRYQINNWCSRKIRKKGKFDDFKPEYTTDRICVIYNNALLDFSHCGESRHNYRVLFTHDKNHMFFENRGPDDMPIRISQKSTY